MCQVHSLGVWAGVAAEMGPLHALVTRKEGSWFETKSRYCSQVVTEAHS